MWWCWLAMVSGAQAGELRRGDVRALERACVKQQDADACARAGEAFLEHNGVDMDLEQAATYAQWGCERGSGRGCLVRGQTIEHMMGGSISQTDAQRVVQLYLTGCEGGYLPACETLQTTLNAMHARLGLADRDVREALTIACDVGVTSACVQGRVVDALADPGAAVLDLGAPDAGPLGDAMTRSMRDLRACTRELREPSPERLEFEARFVVLTDGQVHHQMATRTTPAAPELEQCLARRIAELTLPAPGGDALTVVRLKLAAGQGLLRMVQPEAPDAPDAPDASE